METTSITVKVIQSVPHIPLVNKSSLYPFRLILSALAQRAKVWSPWINFLDPKGLKFCLTWFCQYQVTQQVNLPLWPGYCMHWCLLFHLPSVLEQIRSVLGNDKCADCGNVGEYRKISFCWSEGTERETTQLCTWFLFAFVGWKLKDQESRENLLGFACKNGLKRFC